MSAFCGGQFWILKDVTRLIKCTHTCCDVRSVVVVVVVVSGWADGSVMFDERLPIKVKENNLHWEGTQKSLFLNFTKQTLWDKTGCYGQLIQSYLASLGLHQGHWQQCCWPCSKWHLKRKCKHQSEKLIQSSLGTLMLINGHYPAVDVHYTHLLPIQSDF